ncbi:hypothetical protein TREMEDRAFT_70004 [Tremella mesenterica DSM 1558]|uniref:uncharacterized protein n=1 Tax=Tremella mesenterica (strain ATCC 24925 / CBS 8224 / DSM 1558 / NBRC 9311 / NRRL Y-6157 / RJB 2259-6 / UBC 559-6) TaxID=578456 RepID=UPI00032BDBE0|nr:uncharacterized protein TREMEDRAFT_70004 [Tremella mesenterica DSM 1558]EIW66653.1 hypothetical protein TREMEDRAFT_70004 [Tremella mesenterica DSM 1558]
MKSDTSIVLSQAAQQQSVDGISTVEPTSDLESSPKYEGHDIKEKEGESVQSETLHELERGDSKIQENHDHDQPGVRQADAITRTWSKTSLRVVYLFLWLTYTVNTFQSSITGSLTAYVTSGFEEHSLIPVISIVSNVMSVVAYMVLAKILNLWDKSYGYLACCVLAILGLVLSAACTEIYTYCAAQSKGLAYAFTASPWVITAYAGPAISERFYDYNWRWAFGAFAIILPFVAVPLFGLMQWHKRKAAKAGLVVKAVPDVRSWTELVWYYLIEFDVLGVFLISGGMVLFLVPFSIATSTADEWRSASIIVMLVPGILCLIAFTLYEKYLSPVPFVPWRLLHDRTVITACGLCFTWQIAYYCWASYFTSYLQVVYDLSISEAGYISYIYNVIATIWMLPTGNLIRRTGYYKWILLIGVPLYVLGEGLMIRFRQPAFGGSSFTCVEQVAVLSVGSHNDSAAMLALLGLFGYYGGAVGNSISGAIWTNTLPKYLKEYLPEETIDSWEDIYNDLDQQLSFPMGDPTRTAINEAYAVAQSRMLIAGTAVMALALVFTLMMRNINVSKIHQVKGVLF